VTNSEGLYPSATFITKDDELAKFDSEFELLAPFLLDFNATVTQEDREAVISAIREEYFGNNKIDKNSASQIIKVFFA